MKTELETGKERPPVGDSMRRSFSMNLPTLGRILRDTLRQWNKDNASHMAAALAFYSLFSLTPVVMIAIAMTGLVLGHEAVQRDVIQRIRILGGSEMAEAVRLLIGTPRETGSRITATIVGAITLLIGATAVFADLQGSLNTIWKVIPKPNSGVMDIVRNRFLSFLMVLGIGLFLMASFGVSALITAWTSILGYGPALPAFVLQWAHGAVSFLAVTVLFALIYKLLPDVTILWSDVWIGALVTSSLFTIGKVVIQFFLARTLAGPASGKVGSLVAFLLWLYYSAQVFFLGAEFTHVYAKEVGSRILTPPSLDAPLPAETKKHGT